MKGLGESQLKNFTLDAPTESVYHFEGEDFREKQKVSFYLFIMYIVSLVNNNEGRDKLVPHGFI